MDYRDVVVHTNAGVFGRDEMLRNYPPIQQRLELSAHISLEFIQPEIAKAIMDVCDPKVLGIPSPVRQFAQLYSFVRQLPRDQDIYRWDEKNELTATLGLSRLVHPTSVGLSYAARLGYEQERVKEIFPAQIVGVSKHVFLSPSRTRDWLTEAEARSLSKIVPKLNEILPKRVHNALWHHEYALRTFYLDHRWTLVCTGLEALVHTESTKNTRQFAARVSRLASELGITLSEVEAIEAYDMRSRLAHGVSFIATGTVQLQLYDRLEDTLRTAVLRGMQDKSFATIFDDDDQIRKRWPI